MSYDPSKLNLLNLRKKLYVWEMNRWKKQVRDETKERLEKELEDEIISVAMAIFGRRLENAKRNR